MNNLLTESINANKDYVTKFSIGNTVSGKQIPCLQIGPSIHKKKDSRKAIIIMARQHPG